MTSVTDPHDRELAAELWSAVPRLRARYRELYQRDPAALFQVAGDAADTRDMRAIIAIGQVLAEAGELGSQPARKLSFASRYAACLIEHERFEDAAAVLQDPRVADAAHHKYWRQLALALAGAGRLADAHAATVQSLRIRPDFREASLLAADLEAIPALEGRVQDAPTWPDIRALADLYLKFGLRGPARELLDRTLSQPRPKSLRKPWRSVDDVIAILEAAVELLDPAVVRAALPEIELGAGSADRREAIQVRCDILLGRAEAVCAGEGGRERGGRDLRLQLALAWAARGRFDEAIERLGRLSLGEKDDNEIRTALAYCIGADVLGRAPLQLRPASGRRIFNLVPFNDELAMLDLRLAEMAGWVDRFVIVEATRTFTGDPKPLHFLNNASRYSEYGSKLLHVVVDDAPPYVQAPWARDFHQRDSAIAAISGLAAPDDLVLLTDADEIVDRRAIERFDGEFACLMMHMYRFFLNYRPRPDHQPQRRTAAVWRAKDLARFGSSYARFALSRHKSAWPMIWDAGWHFTSVRNPADIVAKVNSYAHQERKPRWRDETHVAELLARIRAGKAEKGWERCEIDDSYPDYIRRNLSAFAELII